MSFERYIKQELLYSKVFILIGIIAGITGFVFEYQKGVYYTVCGQSKHSNMKFDL